MTALDDPALQAVLAALPQARLVGGVVRDTIAGHPVSDVDLATPEPPDAVMAALGAAGLKVVATGLQHGTVTAVSGGRPFEVTTLRRDDATDGRHAAVSWTADWAEDAARRDFTVNAMSMDRHGTVFDYFGGRADLAAGRVRFVGEAARRIAEDYLRVLRFFRFQGRYGVGDPDAATAAALREGAAGLGRLSVERVWMELRKILVVPRAVAAVRLMAALGVLDAALPEGADVPGFARLVEAGAPSDAVLRLAALLPQPDRVARRLKLSGAEAAALGLAYGAVPPDDAAGLRRALADVPRSALLHRAWLGGAGPALRERIAGADVPVFPLGGRDAVALGVPAGPRVGVLLAAARDWWMAGGCVADAAACRAELARLAAG